MNCYKFTAKAGYEVKGYVYADDEKEAYELIKSGKFEELEEEEFEIIEGVDELEKSDE